LSVGFVVRSICSRRALERDTALDMITLDPDLRRYGQIPDWRQGLPARQLRDRTRRCRHHLDPADLRQGKPRPHQRFLRPFCQIIESVNQTLKTQLDLERHGSRTRPGVCARVLQRRLALTAAIWHKETTSQPGPARSLLAYDHRRPATPWSQSSRCA
jgi:hypothetical protein